MRFGLFLGTVFLELFEQCFLLINQELALRVRLGFLGIVGGIEIGQLADESAVAGRRVHLVRAREINRAPVRGDLNRALIVDRLREAARHTALGTHGIHVAVSDFSAALLRAVPRELVRCGGIGDRLRHLLHLAAGEIHAPGAGAVGQVEIVLVGTLRFGRIHRIERRRVVPMEEERLAVGGKLQTRRCGTHHSRALHDLTDGELVELVPLVLVELAGSFGSDLHVRLLVARGEQDDREETGRDASEHEGPPWNALLGTNVLLSQFGLLYHTRAFRQTPISTAERNDMATRKKKASSEGGASTGAKKLTRAELKQKIRELKKKRQDAGTHSAKAKVHEFNE